RLASYGSFFFRRREFRSNQTCCSLSELLRRQETRSASFYMNLGARRELTAGGFDPGIMQRSAIIQAAQWTNEATDVKGAPYTKTCSFHGSDPRRRHASARRPRRGHLGRLERCRWPILLPALGLRALRPWHGQD